MCNNHRGRYDLRSGGHETAFCDMLYENHDSEEEERDLHHQDMYMNGGRNHHFGPPPTQEG